MAKMAKAMLWAKLLGPMIGSAMGAADLVPLSIVTTKIVHAISATSPSPPIQNATTILMRSKTEVAKMEAKPAAKVTKAKEEREGRVAKAEKKLLLQKRSVRCKKKRMKRSTCSSSKSWKQKKGRGMGIRRSG